MADYQLTTSDDNGPVLRRADNAHIPNDPANRDWQEYQGWLAEGNTPDPYVPPPDPEPPPPDANKRLDNGVTGAVDAWNTNTPTVDQQAGGQGGLSVEERLIRLEETIKAMCQGHMLLHEPELRWRDHVYFSSR